MPEQRVAVIADSTCYLPAGWAAELGIELVDTVRGAIRRHA